ncbi:MAG: zinc-binding dehydrogenase [Acidobacteria bacterium]|nr:zinc-binding dehydrogenase [Acidobacteriota bacterium]MBI3422253.1 zinc-binding dehydrogenase [Acidobacteriota bacterium]
MKAIVVHEFGGIDAMKLEEWPDPVPGPGQLLVRVKASGINFAETRMRAGNFFGQELPFVMGMESAGVVEAVGEGVTGFKAGDRVFGRARGSHAEKVLMGAEHALHLPDNLTFEQGAAIPVGWLTAWHGLITVAQLKPGQRVLIEAVASSVGSAALQIAKWRNAWVAGTASRDDKVQKALAWGADAAYNYKTEDVAKRVQADTGGKGIDVGMMTIGAETAQTLWDVMAMDGKVIMYGTTGGRVISFDLAIGMKNLQLLSISITSSPAYFTVTLPEFRAQALPLFAGGIFKPVVDCVLPLKQVGKAHEMIDARTHFGKVILSVP